MTEPSGKSREQGLVSVVVTSYNHARFLDERMRSLLGQRYGNMEIIVVDDRSTDDSVSVLEKYGTDPRVRLVVRERNGGWVAASNHGYELSTGEYVIFANCDDSCTPDLIGRLVAALEESPSAGLAFARSSLLGESGETLGTDFESREARFRRRCGADTVLSGEEMTRFLLHSCVIPNLSGAMFRAACYEDSGRLDEEYRVCSDWVLYFRVAERFDVSYVAEPLNYFRQHPRSIRESTKARVLFEEYMRLLYGYHRRISLAPWDRFRLKVRLGALASQFMFPSARNAGGVWSLVEVITKYDSMGMLYLALGLAARTMSRFRKSMRKAIARTFSDIPGRPGKPASSETRE